MRTVHVPVDAFASLIGTSPVTRKSSALRAVLHELSGVLEDATVPKSVHDVKAWHRLCIQVGGAALVCVCLCVYWLFDHASLDARDLQAEGS